MRSKIYVVDSATTIKKLNKKFYTFQRLHNVY
jgi:hypothetical protein